MDAEKRNLIDRILKKNAAIEASLGIDSTEEERTKAKEEQQELFEQIKVIDIDFFDVITANKGQRRSEETVKWLIGKNIL